MARIFLIVNANATRHSTRRQHAVQDALSSEHKLEVVTTTHRGHATLLAAEAALSGADAVIVLGGDGTINEALNGLVDSGVPLGILPGGNTNVLARTLGISKNLVAATEQLLRGLRMGRARSIGLGKCNERWFSFVAGVGFDAMVVERVEQRIRMKHMYGDWFFIGAAVATFFKSYDRIRPVVNVTVDGETFSGLFYALCLNSAPYTYVRGRPFNPAPRASFDRGIWLLAPRQMTVTWTLEMVFSALWKARAFSDPRVLLREDLDAFTITCDRPLPYQVDGDYLGELTEAKVSWEPSKLAVIV